MTLSVDRPGDVERLWREGERLTGATLPAWLDLDTIGLYRRATTAVPAGEERARLEAVGFVVDETGVYVPEPAIEVFSIGIASGPSPVELEIPAEPCLTREDVTDVVAVTIADPFMLRREGGWHMFLEVWDWHENKGAIGYAASEDGLAWSYEGIVLAEDFHLSFPCVFQWEGEVYLVPESFRTDAVRLYRARRFPGEWECVTELVAGGELVDPCPFHARGRWWLLAGRDDHSELRLFHSPELLGPWAEHPASPVVEDDPVRSRPAGRVVVDGDRILRFAQRCDTGYGLDVRAFELELSPAAYSERELPGLVLGASGSGWNANGMHHVDPHRLGPGAWLACVDGWRAPGV